MWARTWVPRPSRNRPLETSASSQADSAVTIGLRGNATAIPVLTSMSAARAAAAHARYAVRAPSVTTRPVKPADAASRARSWMRRSGAPVVISSKRMGLSFSYLAGWFRRRRRRFPVTMSVGATPQSFNGVMARDGGDDSFEAAYPELFSRAASLAYRL